MNPLNVRVYAKLNKYLDKLLVKMRRKKINNTDFSIICNNCWGGYVYRRYGLPYLSPTVGLYFYASDYIKLVYDLKNYMEKPLVFIPYVESKHKAEIIKKGQQNAPIARLGDIEIIFLHYKSEKEAREKWERRVKRINYHNLIFKFSKMNGCTLEDLRKFDELAVSKKFMFVPPSDATTFKSAIAFKSAKNLEEIKQDTDEYNRYVQLNKVINAQYVCGNYIQKGE